MILRLTVRDVQAQSSHDIECVAAPDSTVGALLNALPVAVGARRCYIDEAELDPHTQLAASPVVAGSVISVGGPGPNSHPAVSGAVGFLTVIDGEDIGLVVALRPGKHTVARDAQASVPLRETDVSRRHAVVEVRRDGQAAVVDIGSTNGTFVNGVLITGATWLAAGDEVRVGGDTLRWQQLPPASIRMSRTTDGRLEFDRAFASTPRVASINVDLPVEQPAVASNIVAKVTSFLMPVGGAVIGVAASHNSEMLWLGALGLIGPLGFMYSESSQRRKIRGAFAAAKAATHAQIDSHVADESAARHLLAPGVVEIARVATGVHPGLWPRGLSSPHGLALRVGVADQPASVAMRGKPWPGMAPPMLRATPVVADLRSIGVLGVVGPDAPVRALLRWLLIQAATLRAPGDLRLFIIASGDDGHAWARWLPHLDAGSAAEYPCRIGTTDETRAARIEELRQMITARRTEHPVSSKARWTDETVVVLDGALALRNLPGMAEILRDGPDAGVYVICADQQGMNECRGICTIDGDQLTLHSKPGDPPITAIPDGIAQATAEQLARALAPMRDRAASADRQAAIPYPLRLLDVLELRESTAEAVAASWARSTGPTTRVVIGADSNGPVAVDLARQGPHTMLGGATGAGKSILLRTLITSLLLVNSPDELNLVLVDFKGGSAFLPFERCPHVGTLIRSTGESAADVFDETAATRTLAAIRAEVRRRESILARYDGEIDHYWRSRHTNPALLPLPRLVMVFDEFARVLESSPDFLKELVNVAAKGRSLGIHLVLATQSLQGKLSPELKNNISLRISLRQNEPSDSIEVLGVADAATLPGTFSGRGMILCTTDASRAPQLFQTGYLGDPPPTGQTTPVSARVVGWSNLGSPRPVPQAVRSSAKIDQDLIVAAIEQAGHESGVGAPHRPLLPALPAQLPLSQLDAIATDETTSTTIPFGLIDQPEAQKQPRASLNLAGTDQLLVVGGPQSGRTTFARTLIASLVERLSPDQAHLYVIERRPSGLTDVADLPHCGGVFSPTEPDRIRRLITWLSEETRRRAETVPAAGRTPAIVLVIDGWEHFENRTDPTFTETSLTQTLREIVTSGSPLGVYVVAIGGQEMLTSKTVNLYGQRLLLPFPNEQTRRAHLPSGATSPPMLPGRAVDAATGTHIQICQPGWPPTHPNGLAKPTTPPRRFPSLPTVLTADQLAPPPQLPTPTWIPVGLGGPDTRPVGIDLFDAGPHLMLISGPPGSGRTTSTCTIIQSLRHVDVHVLALAPPRSPLHRHLAAVSGVRVISGITLNDADLREAVAEWRDARYAVVVDDADQLTVQPTKEGFQEQPTLLNEILHPATLGQRALIMAVDATTITSGHRRSLARPINETIATGTRLLLTPNRAMAKDHGLALEADQYFTAPKGRGYLAVGRDATLLQATTAAD